MWSCFSSQHSSCWKVGWSADLQHSVYYLTPPPSSHRNHHIAEWCWPSSDCFLPGISRCSSRLSCTSHILPNLLSYKRQKKKKKKKSEFISYCKSFTHPQHTLLSQTHSTQTSKDGELSCRLSRGVSICVRVGSCLSVYGHLNILHFPETRSSSCQWPVVTDSNEGL